MGGEQDSLASWAFSKGFKDWEVRQVRTHPCIRKGELSQSHNFLSNTGGAGARGQGTPEVGRAGQVVGRWL